MEQNVVCAWCSTDLAGKSVSIEGGEVVCKVSCDLKCGDCNESKKFSETCYACKRNLHIANRLSNKIDKMQRDRSSVEEGDEDAS